MMGLLLKLCESITEINVYTLLLNVDFIPLIGHIDWVEPIEFLFHLLISIVIAFIFIISVEFLQFRGQFPSLWFLSFIICLPAIGSYFILSDLSNKEVPQWDDWLAFTYWCVAHVFYMWLLPLLYKKKRSASLR
ncbi:hypothetical protein [Paenisporosarcina indica]|uniref:hypothetical protein n=1 Tax=Paenisporosarcina indica TaxID=650093 RepID=UPI001FEAED8A|nr:hypothetical protein [Paenisporosarcina indica]